MRYTILLLMLFSAVALAADSGTMIRASGLSSSPDATSQSLGIIRGQTSVEILERDGGWYRVKASDGRTGWVRMANVRLGGATAKEEETGFWGSLFSFGSRGSTRTATATTGIRGLSEEEINAAVPNEAAVRRLDDWRSNAAEAQRHAGEGGLAPVDVSALPEDEQ